MFSRTTSNPRLWNALFMALLAVSAVGYFAGLVSVHVA